MTRETTLRERFAFSQPDLIVDLYLYPAEAGGRAWPINLGWGCPCSKDKSLKEGWDDYPLLESEMKPGEQRRVGFVFLSGQNAVEALAQDGHFYLREACLIGEGTIVR
ncbi:hypothetical protein G3545_00130 [Starkeya sp. ORNL1]|uniref:hypothetical protein n=1 Tax=Starkeya sp. ORNL1 TaxID=2709380 RepID=UPI001463B4FB|nr:hypothetical protein [Starkeya sp. ORNL1]QJP12206.1 hypothetical protein G3545_00130 [Starkeya sp. ORNL1]